MTIPLSGTLVLIGAGKMGGAMLQGWLARGVPAGRVVVLDPAPPAEIQALIDKAGIAHNPEPRDIADAEVVLIAIKPQITDKVLPPLAMLGDGRPLILSVVAGKTIASFAKQFGNDAAIIRSIPNTPAAVGRGITAMTANSHVSKDQMALATALLGAIGEVVTVEDEALMDAVTAVSGSGPAYIFHMTECLARAGVKAGLPDALATRLARATVAGSGELMRASGIEAATLRENVTSPKGTTDAALKVLMAKTGGLEALMVRAVAAATKRSRELAS